MVKLVDPSRRERTMDVDRLCLLLCVANDILTQCPGEANDEDHGVILTIYDNRTAIEADITLDRRGQNGEVKVWSMVVWEDNESLCDQPFDRQRYTTTQFAQAVMRSSHPELRSLLAVARRAKFALTGRMEITPEIVYAALERFKVTLQ
jgi:hypothetical protein